MRRAILPPRRSNAVLDIVDRSMVGQSIMDGDYESTYLYSANHTGAADLPRHRHRRRRRRQCRRRIRHGFWKDLVGEKNL